MNDPGVITGVSVSHDQATVEEIESAGGESDRATAATLLSREGVSEAFALGTCNRSEAYVVTDNPADGRAALSSFASGVREGAVERLDHEGSIEHLMRVAAGLESLVLGEDQILGQVRTAYEDARAAGAIGPMLEEAVTKAIHVGERARSETAINEGAVSLGTAAVRLAGRELDLDGATALVVGAGEMGTLAARALAEADVAELVVANRTVPHAEYLAGEVDVEARGVPLEWLPVEVEAADLVVTATGASEYLVDRGTLGAAGETVVVDLGQPRDVDPAVEDLPGVDLYDIDALESVTSQTREQRRREAAAVERMIEDERERLLNALKRRQADDAIGAMYGAAERVKGRELEEAMTKLEAQGGLNEDQRETVEAFADALVGQLLAAPTRSLRDAAGEDDWTTIQTALQLFDPEFGGDVARPPGATGSPSDAGERPSGSSEGHPGGAGPEAVSDGSSDE